MMIVTLFNTLNYAVTMIGLENVNESAIEEIKNNENLQEEEKNKMIESQNNYIEQVEKIQRETFIIITLICSIFSFTFYSSLHTKNEQFAIGRITRGTT